MLFNFIRNILNSQENAKICQRLENEIDIAENRTSEIIKSMTKPYDAVVNEQLTRMRTIKEVLTQIKRGQT